VKRLLTIGSKILMRSLCSRIGVVPLQPNDGLAAGTCTAEIHVNAILAASSSSVVS